MEDGEKSEILRPCAMTGFGGNVGRPPSFAFFANRDDIEIKVTETQDVALEIVMTILIVSKAGR